MSTPLLLIGGSNIDYIGISQNKLISNVSNIGTISISFGGVMRNICENLARLNNNITFITAIGKDTLGQELKKQLIDSNNLLYCLRLQISCRVDIIVEMRLKVNELPGYFTLR